MFPPEHVVTVVTDGSGVGSADSGLLSGRIWQIRYEKVDFAVTVDFTITTKTGGVGLWTESDVDDTSRVVRPRLAVHDDVGAVATLNGTQLMREPAMIFEEAIHIAVAQGGDTKSGKFYLMVG